MNKLVVKRYKRLLVSLKKYKHEEPVNNRILLFCNFIGLVDDPKEVISSDLAKKYLDFLDKIKSRCIGFKFKEFDPAINFPYIKCVEFLKQYAGGQMQPDDF